MRLKTEFALKIQLSGGGQTYYLTDEGWGTKDYRFPVHGSLQDMFWDRDLSTNYVDDYEGNFKITADGTRFGQLTISAHTTFTWRCRERPRSGLPCSSRIATNDVDCKAVVLTSVNLRGKASTSHEDIDICLTDVPFVENADKMFYNGLKIAGKYTSAWSCGGKTDSFLYTILKSVCSRIGFPWKQLSGTIQGENLESLMLLVDKYSGSLFHPREFSLNLLTDELNVTLDQFMPYQELSGTTTESPRIPVITLSEYHSSGENETRVYQSGAGVPMRIRDLSPVELQADSVIEVDRTNVAKSGKVTLQKVLEFVLNAGNVWTKEELKIIEGYILYLGEKIKAGDSDLWKGHSFEDYLDQPVKTGSDVIHNSVTARSFTEEDSPNNDNVASTRLQETGSGYIGDMDNVSDEANTATEGSMLIKGLESWFRNPTYSGVESLDNLIMPVFNTLTKEWQFITVPSGGVNPPVSTGFPFTFPIMLS